MAKIDALPAPACRYGYSYDQIEEILGSRKDEFYGWMRGQTVSLCDGRTYDYAVMEYKPTDCGPHGMVVYDSDLRCFLAGHAPLD